MDKVTNPTSLKQLFAGLVPEGAGVVEGTVTSIKPLSITLVNDAKMTLSAASLVVPRHLTDYEVEVDLKLSSGAISSTTKTGQGEHAHSGGNHEGHISGNGSHSHSGDGTHVHSLSSFSLTSGILTVHNGLTVGDSVFLLRYSDGKRYYVLDRKG
jgi:hypothetical protein